MPLYSADALILRTYKLGEADRIVVFLTRDRGKKRGVAKGARRPRSKFVGGLEPFTQVRVAYFEKERRELVSVNYSEPSCSPLSAANPEALGYTQYFAELLDEWAQDADPDERLYRLGSAMVEAVVAGVPAEPLARYFEYWLLRLQGLYPAHLQCHQCGGALGTDRMQAAFLAPGEREFTCGACAPRGRGLRLSADALAFLSRARTINPLHLDGRLATTTGMRELEAVHRALITAHLDKEPKSIQVLNSMRHRL
ncbi:MAG TPA: DNA repair protein RecO [Vicinamibacterales bacterium]|jgi:DNA repair protein RecO (recombination protein O)